MKESITVKDLNNKKVTIFTKYIIFYDSITKPSFDSKENKWIHEDTGTNIHLTDSHLITTSYSKEKIDSMIFA